MDWEKSYQKLREATLNNKKVNGDDIIDKVKFLREWHRKMFVEYFDAIIENELIKLSTFKTYRATILDFLLQEKINNIYLSELSQADLDDFLVVKGQAIKASTLDNNTHALKSYIDYHAKHLNFKPEFTFFYDNPKASNNKTKPLTSKELEQIHEILQDNPFFQFAFGLAYENGIRFEDSREYNKDNYDEENGIFTSVNNQQIKISERLKNVIDKIKDTEEFKDQYYKQGFSFDKIKEHLILNGFNRPIKSSDINKTYEKRTSFNCPECGLRHESTANNWIIKQYYENGELWIVCKKCGEL